MVPGKSTVSAELVKTSEKIPTFYVANRNRVGTEVEHAKLIKEYLKHKPLDGRQQDAIVVYQVIP